MFDLTITFAGMCLLVRDPAHGMFHVLMPETDAAHPHYPRLVFVDETGTFRKEPIEKMHLELPGVSGSNGFSANAHPEVYDWDDPLLDRRTVKQALLDPASPLPSGVASRIRLTAGKHGDRRRGGLWAFNGGTVVRRLPTAMDWVIEDVKLPHLTVEDKVGGGTFKVVPRNGAIHLLMVNVTAKERDAIVTTEIPPHADCPPANEDAHHMELYFPILDPPDSATLPKFDRAASHDAGLCATPILFGARAAEAHGNAATPAAAAGGSELTCMVTTAPAA